MSYRILLVDDDRLVLATMARGLQSRGYEIITASSGEAAVEMVGEKIPDLAILDMRMSGMSGLETARALKNSHNIPHMYLSAYEDEELLSMAGDEDNLGYLVKPLDIEQIVSAVESALAKIKRTVTG